MKLTRLDHFVLTTGNVAECLHFYRDVLGMDVREQNGRLALFFGSAELPQKINIHRVPAEFPPAAAHPASGSLDLCLLAEGPMQDIQREIAAAGWPVEMGPVERSGAVGVMDSLYLRDPDGNLIEISVPRKK